MFFEKMILIWMKIQTILVEVCTYSCHGWQIHLRKTYFYWMKSISRRAFLWSGKANIHFLGLLQWGKDGVGDEKKSFLGHSIKSIGKYKFKYAAGMNNNRRVAISGREGKACQDKQHKRRLRSLLRKINLLRNNNDGYYYH